MADTAVVSALNEIIEERLVPDVQDMLLDVEPVFDQIPITSANVKAADDGFGRQYLVVHTFSSGVAGALQWVDPSADTIQTDTLSHTQLPNGITSTWPTASEMPMKDTFQRKIPVAEGRGNVAMPLAIWQADKLNASIANWVEANFRACAHNLALQEANALYANTSGHICDIATVESGGTHTDDDATVTIENGRIRQLEDGMMVDVIVRSGGSTGATGDFENSDDNAQAAANSVPCYVDSVDPLAEQVTLKMPDGTKWANAQAALDLASVVADASDIVGIFLADSWDDTNDLGFRGPMSLNDFILDSGTLFEQGDYANYTGISGISLASHPKFKSKVASSVGVLDEQTLNEYVGAFWEAYGLPLDTVITTRGVTEKFAEQPYLDAGRMVMDRTNAALNMQAGRAKVGYEYEGRSFNWYVSAFCPAGTLYAIKRKGNLRRYVPPFYPETRSGPGDFSNVIQFVGESLGWPDIWIPVQTSAAKPTPMKQAPFSMFYQVLPDQPQSIKLSGITEYS